MGLLDTNRAPRPTVAPRTTGGITGPGKANVTKPYQQMEETKKNVSPQMKPPTVKPSSPLNDTSRMNPTMPSKPTKTRSTYESNRMQ